MKGVTMKRFFRVICICDYVCGDIRYEVRTKPLARLFCLVHGFRIMEDCEDSIYAMIGND